MEDEEKDQQQEEESQEEKSQEQADDQEQEEEVKDKHGQLGINKERHDKEMAAKDAKIAELEGQLDEKLKTEEGRGEIKGEIEKLKEELADERMTHKLELAGCKSVKAAKALLDDHDGDIEALKKAEPYLFTDEKPKGSTGKKPTGAANEEFTDEEKSAFRIK